MTRPTTVRLEQELLEDLTIVARVRGTSVSDILREQARTVVDRAHEDPQFSAKARRVLEQEQDRVTTLAAAADRLIKRSESRKR